jgi:hypothetical protein
VPGSRRHFIMIIVPPPEPKKCIYCGAVYKKPKKGKGEHLIPKAIGGGVTLDEISENRVCVACNGGVLSEIDREFTSRSYLSIVASQEIDAHLWQVWNIDHAWDNLLVEAAPRWIEGLLADLRCYPQLTFETTGLNIRGDAAEMRNFGFENFQKILVRAARSAFQRFCAGKKRVLHFERVEAGVLEEGLRLAPRLFTKDTIQEIASNIDKQSFTLRFANDSDGRFALRSLWELSENQVFKNRRTSYGSRQPRISFVFNVGDTIRGLMKIAVNLIAAYCPNTAVNPDTFNAVNQLIRGNVQINERLMQTNGFVQAKNIESIAAKDRAHSFRLIHANGIWYVYSSFFGGRIGSFVNFPGPNKENWLTADIIAPLYSKDWEFNTSPLVKALVHTIDWNESAKLCPSLKLQDSRASFRVQLVRPGKK